MRYTTDTALKEIISRSEDIRRKKSAGTTALLTTVSGALLLALFAVFSAFVDRSSAGIVFAQYGALMMDEAAGGYVLTAVISFTAGTGITAAVSRLRRR